LLIGQHIRQHGGCQAALVRFIHDDDVTSRPKIPVKCFECVQLRTDLYFVSMGSSIISRSSRPSVTYLMRVVACTAAADAAAAGAVAAPTVSNVRTPLHHNRSFKHIVLCTAPWLQPDKYGCSVVHSVTFFQG
jgi:hypothetical protein